MTKLGPHILGWNGDVLDFIGQAKPRVIKVVAPWGHDTMKMAEARRRSPDSLWLLRLYVDEQPLHNYPTAHARAFADQIERYVNYYDLFEDYNEIDPRDHSFDPPKPLKVDTIKRYNEFSAEFSHIVHAWGKKHVMGCWSNGQPPGQAWQYMEDCVLAADYVSLHGYGWPTMSQCPDFTLRYRHIYHSLLPFKRPLILSEQGMTHAVFGGPDLGWKSWEYPFGFGAKERQAAAEWAWMLDRANEDHFVFSFHPYTTGRLAGDNWGTHDFTPRLYKLVGDYIKGHPSPDDSWDGSNDEGGESMGKWDNVRKHRPDVAKFKPEIGRATRGHHVPIADYEGHPVSPARVMAVIIANEKNPCDPNFVNEFDEKDRGVLTGRKLHAVGLCGVVAEHTGWTVQELKDPYVNIKTGLSILEGKLHLAGGNLREAYYYYTGGPYWDSKEHWIATTWLIRFCSKYDLFWGVDLGTGSDGGEELLIRIAELEAAMVEARNTLDAKLKHELFGQMPPNL